MLSLTTGEMNAWIAGLLWPLTRILGLVASAPLFGNAGVPMSVKVALGVLLASVIAPTVPEIPAVDPGSWAGILILVKELLIGVAMGFAMRIVFAAVEYAGEVASMTMGLGFAVFFDPSTSGRSAAVAQVPALVVARALLAPGEAPDPPVNPTRADRVRWEHIQRVYELCDHNVSETARRLGMHRRTLQRILAKRAPR